MRWVSLGWALLTAAGCGSPELQHGDGGETMMCFIDWRMPESPLFPASGSVAPRNTLLFTGRASLVKLEDAQGNAVPVTEHGIAVPGWPRYEEVETVRVYQPARLLEPGDYLATGMRDDRTAWVSSTFTVSDHVLTAAPDGNDVQVDALPCARQDFAAVRHAGAVLLLRYDYSETTLELAPPRGTVDAAGFEQKIFPCDGASSLEVAAIDLAGNFSGWRPIARNLR